MHSIRHYPVVILFFSTLHAAFHAPPLAAATVTGTLTDISSQALDTKITFAPANDVLINGSGLSVGAPKTLQTANGSFSLALDAGDYTVSLPLITWRRPFRISVPASSDTINITNLLATPQTYTYTNNLNYALKVEPDDAAADFLDQKLLVSGSITKTLATNSGVVTMTLSSSGGGGSSTLHANASTVTADSAGGEHSLFDAVSTISGGTLSAGNVILIEAFGSYADPAGSGPQATFKVKLGSTDIVTETKAVGASNWHLRALLTVRATGASGSITGALLIKCDNASAEQFACDSQTATVDTTTSLTLSLSASIEDFSGSEAVVCNQLLATLQ